MLKSTSLHNTCPVHIAVRGILKAFLSDGVYLKISHLPGVVFNYYVEHFLRIFDFSNATFLANVATDCTAHRTIVQTGSEGKLICILFQEPETDSRYISVSWQLTFCPIRL